MHTTHSISFLYLNKKKTKFEFENKIFFFLSPYYKLIGLYKKGESFFFSSRDGTCFKPFIIN